jgi:hypothetical protein
MPRGPETWHTTDEHPLPPIYTWERRQLEPKFAYWGIFASAYAAQVRFNVCLCYSWVDFLSFFYCFYTRISSASSQKRTGVFSIEYYLTSYTLLWAGHVSEVLRARGRRSKCDHLFGMGNLAQNRAGWLSFSMQKQMQKRLKSGFRMISWTVSNLNTIYYPPYDFELLCATHPHARILLLAVLASVELLCFCFIWVCISSSSSCF